MEDTTNRKLYSQKGISIATLFGGPLAAGYLIRQNFISLGKEREGLVSVILGILFTVAVFVPLFMLPEEIVDKIPNQLIPAIYTLIIYVIVEAIQGKELHKHKEESMEFESNWKATGIGFLWMLVLIGIIVLYIFTSSNTIIAEQDRSITQKMEQFAKNEEKALKIYEMNLNTSSKEELLKVVNDEGIYYWNQNLQILKEIQQYDLEESYSSYINKLFIYTRTRKEAYNLIFKSIEEDTDKYNTQIEQKNILIERLLTEIEKM